MRYPSAFAALAMLELCCHPAWAAEAVLTQEALVAALEAQEIYVEFYPRDLMVRIREYGISSTLVPETDITQQAALLAQLVAQADYCERRFAIPGYVAAQEVLFATDAPTGTAVHVECVLLTATGMPQSMETAYATVLGRTVTITEERGQTRLVFAGPDLTVGPNNAEQLLGRGNDTMLVWRARERTYEAVFINNSKPRSDFRGIAPFVSEVPVSSPVLDKDKADALRESLRADAVAPE